MMAAKDIKIINKYSTSFPNLALSTPMLLMNVFPMFCSISRADFHFCKKRVGKISSGLQAAPLSELWQGLGVRVKDYHTK
jgi:hypothetical protein